MLINPTCKLFILTLSILTNIAFADVSILLDDGTRIESRSGVTKMSKPGETSEMVYDNHTQTMNIVDHQEGTYTPLTLKQIDESISSMGNMKEMLLSQMQMQLENMPAQQKEEMQAMLNKYLPQTGQSNLPRFNTISQGERNIAGIPCTMQSLYEKKRHIADVCMSIKASANISEDDQASLLGMIDFFREMVKKAENMFDSLRIATLLAQTDLKGWPVYLSDKTTDNRYSVKSVSNKPLEDKQFVSYKAYRKIDMPSFNP